MFCVGWLDPIQPDRPDGSNPVPSPVEFPLNYFDPSYTKYRQQLTIGLTIFFAFYSEIRVDPPKKVYPSSNTEVKKNIFGHLAA